MDGSTRYVCMYACTVTYGCTVLYCERVARVSTEYGNVPRCAAGQGRKSHGVGA